MASDNSPPGTVSLVGYHTARDSSEVVLIPQPSNDPNEPLNWSMSRKLLNFLFIATMSTMAFTLVTFQAIFFQQMTVDLDTSVDLLSHGNSAQLAGLALGCVFFIPFAVKYGRRPVYILSVALMAGGSWWTSRVQSYPELLCANFMTGIAGAINETTVQMTISDLFFVHQRGSFNAIYFVAVMIGSFVSPIPAGAHAAVQGWRWSYYALSIALTALTVIFVFGFEETKYVRPTTPIRNAANLQLTDETNTGADGSSVIGTVREETYKEHNLETCESRLEAEAVSVPNTYRQRMRLITPTDESLWKLFIAPLSIIFYPHVLFTAVQFTFSVAWLVLMVVMNSIFFSSPPYNFNTAGVAYMNIGPFIGSIFGSLYGGPFSDWSIKWLARRNGGVFEPEMRLYVLIVPSLLMAGGMIMYGVTASMGMHWIYPSIGGALFAAGMGSTGDITFTFVIDSFQDVVPEAFVCISFLRNIGGLVLPLVRVQWADAMGYKYQFVCVGCISIAISLLHIPMIIWGKKIRVMLASHYSGVVEKRLNK